MTSFKLGPPSGSMSSESQKKTWLRCWRHCWCLTILFLVPVLASCANDESGDTVAEKEHPGKRIYTRYCFSCHQGGVAGSPVLGDKEAWAPRLAKGRKALVKSTLDGIPPGMPIMGLCLRCTEDEIRDAVDYMLQAVAEEK